MLLDRYVHDLTVCLLDCLEQQRYDRLLVHILLCGIYLLHRHLYLDFLLD